MGGKLATEMKTNITEREPLYDFNQNLLKLRLGCTFIL